MVGYYHGVVGAAPRACPGGTSQNGGKTGRTQGAAPTACIEKMRCVPPGWFFLPPHRQKGIAWYAPSHVGLD
ncbi:MAG: hypothetical protein D3921_10940 [Candidatus Electrothrix sp. AW1]|nr:hypothetical protein [Candidatus Electrothrix sp. AX1]MCI5183007.1 hypothetical protein [Candidatus Electrothrix gigas]